MSLEPPPVPETHALDALHPAAADESDAHVAQLLRETEDLLQSLASSSLPDLTEPPLKLIEHCDDSKNALLHSTVFAGAVESEEPLDAETLSQCERLHTLSSLTSKRTSGGSKPKTGGNVTRERLKAELAVLRTQAATLENELQAAQHKRLAQWLSVATAAPPVWEQIAKRQKRGRECAEAENARLKRMLESQTQYVAGIQESLLRLRHFVAHQQPIVSLHPSLSGSVLAHQTVRIERSDEALYQILLSGLDAAYSRLDEVFHSSGINTLYNTQPFSRVTPKMELRSNGHPRSFVEKVDVKVSPFDFDLKTRVHWICSKRKNSTPNSVEYDKTAHLDDVVAGKFRAKRVFNGAEVSLFVLCASKRFVRKDRVVNVWSALFKGEDSSLFSDVYVQETGWFVTMKLDKMDMKPGGGTVEKTVIHLEPKRFSAPDAPVVAHVEADVMTKLVVDSYGDDSKDLDEMMENMLIEESFRYRK